MHTSALRNRSVIVVTRLGQTKRPGRFTHRPLRLPKLKSTWEPGEIVISGNQCFGRKRTITLCTRNSKPLFLRGFLGFHGLLKPWELIARDPRPRTSSKASTNQENLVKTMILCTRSWKPLFLPGFPGFPGLLMLKTIVFTWFSWFSWSFEALRLAPGLGSLAIPSQGVEKPWKPRKPGKNNGFQH